MATTFRANRAAEAIRMTVSKALREEASDPRLENVTITSVEVTHDLSFARIFYTVLGIGEDDADARRDAQAAFERATPFLRSRVGAEVPLRVVPEISFRFDRGVENAVRLEEIFNSLPELKKD